VTSLQVSTQTARKSAKYDQTATWKRLVARASEVRANPPRVEELAMRALEEFGAPEFPASTVVHIAFDRNIVPSGGVLYRATLLDGRMKTSPEQLAAMGYAVEDGTVRTVNDVPVGPAYSVLEYWGGERQHKRWHLAGPVTIEPSRNGDPYFMDENMIAFGAKWVDGEQMSAALLGVLELFAFGIKGGDAVAMPLAVELATIS
jgi:hypothetical protein